MPKQESHAPVDQIPVAVLGATGGVGQKFVALLADHPWFEIVALTASDRSAGKNYSDTVRWIQDRPLPAAIASMTLQPSRPPIPGRIAFSALDAGAAGPIETAFARSGFLVVSNARSHRMDPAVPLLVPEVNPDHLDLLARQEFGRGAIITNPNCSTIGLVLALKPLHDTFGIDRLQVVTMQAISGAGLSGLSEKEIADNVIPFIDGEEEKMDRETRKILGRLDGDRVEPATVVIGAQCNRVPVTDGHTECVSIALHKPATAAGVRTAWEQFTAEPQNLSLPSAPRRPIHYLDDPRHPQPRLHRDRDGGMAVSVGRLRRCEILDFKFVVLSHNTIRGAAGGAILAAELAVARGLLPDGPPS